MPHQFVPSQSAAPHRITQVHYGVLSAEDVRRLSVLPCRRTTAGETKFGVTDARLGVCERTKSCATCGQPQNECVGHSGHINLEFPVFHLGYFTTVLRICRTLCKTCGLVLLTDGEKSYYLRRFLDGRLSPLAHAALAKTVQTEAAKTRICPHCKGLNGVVRRVRPLRLVHEKFSTAVRRGDDVDARDTVEALVAMLACAADANPDVSGAIRHTEDFLDPLRVLRLFESVPAADVPLLGLRPGTRPEDLIFTSLPVTPVPVRPWGTTFGSQVVRQDELTVQYADILASCDMLRMANSLEPAKLVENWDLLQLKVSRLLDGALPGYPIHLKGAADTKSFAQRMKGKHGRFRGNLSGKRVNYSGRSVISPDPNLDIDELAVPLRIAKELTYPQRVFSHNLQAMRRLVLNGPSCHPGARYVTLTKEGARKDLRFDRAAVAARLAVGDIVDRHVVNGDLMLFNRQPSLHRISMMCHRARVLPFRTLRFNVCCCAPYNADFDGDEMNVHLVQTEEARAEAKALMSTVRNIITAKNGEPIIACTQDFLTGAYLMTSRDCFLDRAQFTQLASHFLVSGETWELPPATILRPKELWTGKQIFDVVLCPAPTRERSLVSFEAGARFYTGKNARHLCNEEGFVCFQNSRHVSGRLDKKMLGGGAKDGLFSSINMACGMDYTAKCMGRIARLTSRWLMNYGFSLGIGDVYPTPALRERKAAVLSESFALCTSLINEAARGQLQPVPGLSVKQTLEMRLNGELSKVREVCGAEAVAVLTPENAPLIMAQSGSKGSVINVAQMMACVGQQTVAGKRIQNSFTDRSLPHFVRYAQHPEARGFVTNSFFSGLTPTEFFFHTMAGREGLVDTAVKTAETGYIYRRLMKAMEDLSVQYDGTVRNSKGDIVQFHFGEDSLDPVLMEGANSTPVNFAALWMRVTNEAALAAATPPAKAATAASAANGRPGAAAPGPRAAANGRVAAAPAAAKAKRGAAGPSRAGAPADSGGAADDDTPLTPAEVARLVAELLGGPNSALKSASSKFRADVGKFWERRVEELIAVRRSVRLPVCAPSPAPKAGVAPPAPAAATMPALTPRETAVAEAWVRSVCNLSSGRVRRFFAVAAEKYRRKVCEPGTPCGAIAAQSVGEPSTQMTLRTFHFAGVASMSITQGVPRLVEIINANKTIATPVIRAPLVTRDWLAAAAIKAQMERVTLKEVTSAMVEVANGAGAHVCIRLARRLLSKLQLPLDAAGVQRQILQFARRPGSLLRALTPDHVRVVSPDTLLVFPWDSRRLSFNVRQLLSTLPDVPVAGLPAIKRALIETKADGSIDLLAEGAELRRVMALSGVDGRRATCNHVGAIEAVLGIEAARAVIVSEIQTIMTNYSLSIDIRHVYLLADVMTHRGVVLGITRFGIQKMNNGVLTMASFERTTEHLYDAAVYQRADTKLSVSENIIVGAPVPLGTNAFRLLYKAPRCPGVGAGAAAAAAAAGRAAASAVPSPVFSAFTHEFHLDM